MDSVWEHRIKLKDKGIALLIVEQKARALLSIADWVYVLVDGQNAVEASGSTLLSDVGRLGKVFMGADKSAVSVPTQTESSIH